MKPDVDERQVAPDDVSAFCEWAGSHGQGMAAAMKQELSGQPAESVYGLRADGCGSGGLRGIACGRVILELEKRA